MTRNCQPPYKWIPGYCRRPPSSPSEGRSNRRPRLTVAEKEAIAQRMRVLEPIVRPSERPTPTMKNRILKVAPHAELDRLNEELREALFRLPWLIPGAVKRFLDKRYRTETPDPHQRYTRIKDEFCRSYNIGEIPDLYEYLVLKTCLVTND